MWVGDARAYLLGGDGEVTALTNDHAYAGGGLRRCLGGGLRDQDARPDVFNVEVGHGHKILLCSDGVSGPTDRMSGDNDTYNAVLGDGLEKFVRHAAENGSDNATAVLVDVDALAAASTSG